MTGPRDWDKELADIDKLMGSAGAAPPPPGPSQNLPAARGPAAAAPAAPAARAAAAPAAMTRPRDTMIVWLKALLGALGAAALIIWPYNRACGMLLYGYLIGVSGVFGAGVWTMLASWKHRRGLAHVVGMAIILVSLGLAAIELLPRVGILSPARSWICTS